MTTAAFARQLHHHSAHNLLALVPFLLGHHPTDSLVVLSLRRARVRLILRVDLPAPDSPDLAEQAAHCAAIAATRIGDGLLLIGYGTTERVEPLARLVHAELTDRRIPIHAVLRATADTFWNIHCKRPACCPSEGTPYDPSGGPIAAAAVVAGCVALPDRAAVVRTMAPPTGAALTAITALTSAALTRLTTLLTDLDRQNAPDKMAGLIQEARAALTSARSHYASGGRLNDEDLAWLTVLLLLIQVRDMAWSRMMRTGRAGRVIYQRLYQDMLCRCDPRLAAPPGMLLGFTCWQLGDGLRANIAIDRALEANPNYTAANLMAEALARGVAPSAVRGRQPTRGQTRPRRKR